ncbi:MAG: Rqc2 family fibronectin-binding protein [Candidatus Rifleibacteriota bacterium]
MDYLTLRKHCSELSDALSSRPLLARIFAIPGRGFAWRMKHKDGFVDLVFQLDPAIQGCWLTNRAVEIEKNSSLIRQMQRLLINGRIVSVGLAGSEEKMQFDRVVKFQIAVADSFFGGRTDFYLVCEFTGRVADIFLCDQQLKIIERFARTSNNAVGNQYCLPDSACQVNPFFCETQELINVFSSSPMETWPHKIAAFSPPVARALADRTREKKNPQALAEEFKKLIENSLASKSAFLTLENERLKSLCTFEPATKAGQILTFTTISEALAYAEEKIVGARRLNQGREQAINHFRRELQSCQKILAGQKNLQAEYANAESLKKIGNLLIANLYRIPAGSGKIQLEDWETGEMIEISLDPAKPVQVQAQKYFQRFRKAQRGAVEVARRIAELNSEISWLNEQIWLTENALSEADLPEISGRVTARQAKVAAEKNSGRKRRPDFKPLLEIDSCRYYVGKNGKQNDLLTFQLATKKDRWFHANDVPGAHVILRKAEGEISETDLLRGALLAAWFSFARESSKVAVDTTEVAWVKKIPGGGPGRVSYTHQKTIFVNPQDAASLIEPAENSKSGDRDE